MDDTPALSGFFDLVQLADHPGDALAYRHFRMTPLAAAKYPNGVPAATVISCEIASSLATRGLRGTLVDLRGCLSADPSEAWSPFTEQCFFAMLREAAEFEQTCGLDARLSDFAAYRRAKRKCRLVRTTGEIER